jgi:transposase InsO family protein
MLVMIDLLTKYAWFNTSDNRKKERTVEFLQKMWAKFKEDSIDPPKIVQSDNGGEFSNVLVTKWCDEHMVKINHGRPGHPQSDGCVERLIHTVTNMLKVVCPEIDIIDNKVISEVKYPCDWVSKYVLSCHCDMLTVQVACCVRRV